MGSELGELADAYLSHYRRTQAERTAGREPDIKHPDWEAFGRVDRLISTGDIEDVWELNIELVKRCSSVSELAYVAAGPIEDMMNRLDETQIDAVLKRADEDPRWRFAVAATHTSRMVPRLAAVIERIRRESTEEQRAEATGL